jgi:hypothetical protein
MLSPEKEAARMRIAIYLVLAGGQKLQQGSRDGGTNERRSRMEKGRHGDERMDGDS